MIADIEEADRGDGADAPFGMLPRTVPGMGDGGPVSRSCSFKCLFTQNTINDKIDQLTAIFVPQKLTKDFSSISFYFSYPSVERLMALSPPW